MGSNHQLRVPKARVLPVKRPQNDSSSFGLAQQACGWMHVQPRVVVVSWTGYRLTITTIGSLAVADNVVNENSVRFYHLENMATDVARREPTGREVLADLGKHVVPWSTDLREEETSQRTEQVRELFVIPRSEPLLANLLTIWWQEVVVFLAVEVGAAPELATVLDLNAPTDTSTFSDDLRHILSHVCIPPKRCRHGDSNPG